MRCANCGEDLREGLRFCPTCGTPVPQSTPAAPVSTPDQPAQTVQVRRPPPSPAGEPVAASAAPPPQQPPAQQMPPPAQPQAAYTPPPSEPFVTGRDPNANYSQPGPQPPPGGQRAAGGIALGSAGTVPTPTGADFSALTQRVIRLFKLDTSVFEELYRDARASIPVAVLVAVVLLISGLGGYLFISDKVGFDLYENGGHSTASFFFLSVILGTVFGLLMWLAWSWITSFLLKQLAGVQAEFLGIARVLGLAFLPLVLALIMLIGDIQAALSWIAFGSMASLAVVGVLEAVESRPGPAWGATLGGFAVFIIVMTFLGSDTRDLAPGFFGVLF